jgi:hypothetical protein
LRSLLVLLPARFVFNCCFFAAIYPIFPANAPRALALEGVRAFGNSVYESAE